MALLPFKMTFRWEDPHLAEMASAFFVAEVHRNREAIAESASAAPTAPAEETDTTADGNDNGWHLGLDNLPEDVLPVPMFLTLLKFHRHINSRCSEPLPETDDGRLAAHVFMFRQILKTAYFFVDRLLSYLLFDKRFHPERKIRANAIQVLRIGNNEAEDESYYTKMKDLNIGLKLCYLVNRCATPNAELASALNILRQSGDIFFMTLGAIFPLCAINKCHMSFSIFMNALGNNTSTESAAKLVKHMKAMQRTIENFDAHGGTISPGIFEQALERQNARIDQLWETAQAIQTSQQTSTKTLVNMDRRQRDFTKFLKNGIAGFVGLFHPQKPKPTREQVQCALQPPDRYACLAHVAEPHRSQIKAVIDYTHRHPIVYRQTKSDDYTLAHAVRDTWRENEARWSLVPGTFATVNDLKSACYNMQKGPNDPFCHQQS